MNTIKLQVKFLKEQQRGIALPTVMIILLLAGLAALYTAQTSVKEQQVTADQYRSDQSFAAAQAGVDTAVQRHNYFEDFTQDGCGNTTPETDINSDCTGFTSDDNGSFVAMFCDVWDDDGDESISAAMMQQFLDDTFSCTNPITADADGFRNDTRVGILSVGKSDDDTGRRTIHVVSAPARVIGRDGPPLQPLVARSTVDVTGDMRVINRYENSNIWSGGEMSTLGNMQTFVNSTSDPAPTLEGSDDPRLDLVNPDEAFHATQASGKSIGANSDVIDKDYNLDELTPDDLFAGFFSDGREGIRGLVSEENKIKSVDDVAGKSGLVWLDGTQDDSDLNGQIGGNLGTCSPTLELDPILLIVELNKVDEFDPSKKIKFAANTFICGLVFVFGGLETVGTLTVSGAMIATGSMTLGAGGSTVVYDPEAIAEPPQGFKGSRGLDEGTWKDW